jgi:hypothetical protein
MCDRRLLLVETLMLLLVLPWALHLPVWLGKGAPWPFQRAGPKPATSAGKRQRGKPARPPRSLNLCYNLERLCTRSSFG